MSLHKHPFLGEILLKSGIIYENQLINVLNEQKRSHMRFGEILLKNGWISETELIHGLSEQLHIPLADLSDVTPQRKLLEMIPRSLSERLHIIPIEFKNDNTIIVATAEPMDLLVKDELHFYTGSEIEFVLASSSDIALSTIHFYDSLKEKIFEENNTARNALIGGILLNTGLISEKQVQKALREQQSTHMRFGEILLKNGWLSERELSEGLGKQLGIPVYSIKDFLPEREAMVMIPENVALRLQALPLSILENGNLRIAVAEPMDVLAIDELRNITGMELEVWIAVPSELKREIPSLYRDLYKSQEDHVKECHQTLLGQVLLNAGMISEEKLEHVLDLQKSDHRRLGDILLEKGFLNERELAEGVSRQMKIPTVLLSDYKPRPDLLDLLPRSFAEKYQVLPLEETAGGDVAFAVAEPLSLDVIDELSKITGRNCVFRIVRPSSLKKEIPYFYSLAGVSR